MGCPKVTVIIPVYKVERYLRGAVQSVIDQTYKNINIILVDDGSPDNCPQICDELGEKHDNITVIHKVNGGLSSARNAGLDSINNTDYVLFLDSDDKLPKEAIEGLVKEAETNHADIVIPDRYVKVFEESGREEIAYLFPKEMYRENAQDFVLDVVMEQGRAWRASAVLYSYKTINTANARFPLGRIAEDVSFNFIIMTAASTIAIYPYSTLRVLKHSGSITATFQKNFEKDIWYIDEQAREFLKRNNRYDEKGIKKADALLCRNIVVYLIDIMSHKNSMNYRDKKKKAKSLLSAPEARNVVRSKHNIPYFEKKKVRMLFRVVYWMLQHNMDAVVFKLLSLV